MKKIVVIVLVLAAAIWFKQQGAPEALSSIANDGGQKQTRPANSSECEKIGGSMVEGMGCVKGPVPDDLKFNQHIDPRIVEEHCDSVGGRYDADKNLCRRE